MRLGRACRRRAPRRGRARRRRFGGRRTEWPRPRASRPATTLCARPRAAGRAAPSAARIDLFQACRKATIDGAEPPVPSFVMDLTETTRPVLHPLVEELLADERLAAYAAALPASARVSEPALPLVIAALHQHLGRALVVLVPEDADARDGAEAGRWLLGEDRVALLPSRGVRLGSGLAPPPHLVGERARALDVLAAGGLVCASAAAIAEPLPPPGARRAPIRLAAGEAPGLEALAELLALAGYERVDRVQERGHFAVRGGLIDLFPTTGREPLRAEFFGDEIEAVRAFSAFTQRALREVEGAVVYPAAERRLDLQEPTLHEDGEPTPVPEDLVPPLERPPGLGLE